MAVSNTTTSPCTVAVAVSGGVDSLCALVMLRQAGHRVLALHGLFLPEAELAPPPGLEEACAVLDVPLHIADLRPVFQREVLAPFAAAYAAGRTPNPCALCNRAIKFGALLDAAQKLGAQKLATGHYARLVSAPEEDVPESRVMGRSGREHTSHDDTALKATCQENTAHDDTLHLPLLAAAHDATKDQSYFLSLVPRARLAHACFPLADQDKTRTREIVAQAGLTVPLPSESQDICFAPAVGDSADQASSGGSVSEAYRPFLERHWQAASIMPPGPGPVVLRSADGTRREIARHKGLWRYTEGQRKGLGIAHSEPLYVLAKDGFANTLVVGPRALLGVARCTTGIANVALPTQYWRREVLVRLRHRHRPAPASVRLDVEGRLEIAFAEPQFPSAPGQVAAVYDAAGRVLAAGIVEFME
ncbi:MAG: tRNA 2-thiouridine(34) synthase MnmA [Desulfovibrio sp. MES5]|uniref:MnmA/TRMU family protein n=1 Tax=Desulfovibrio sp. MES5 TaxID=1899016 RepID=UPI000B9D1186|nr:tRNA-specific 2-thiouridylase [Desulfovibrio sp. MES5]OXS27707.1 MAG: tRNA 2-thiouridine(34) synthase MnmA [Desulfovibrio sp. MES5]